MGQPALMPQNPFGYPSASVRYRPHKGERYYSVMDLIAELLDADHKRARRYWSTLKQRLKEQGTKTVTNYERVRLRARDGKMRLGVVVNAEQALRLIQLIPSPKVEAMKLWLASEIFSYLPTDDIPDIVQTAINILGENPAHEAAQKIMTEASLQAPSVLHPHLDTLFDLNPNGNSYYADFPWQESGLQHLDYLRRVVTDSSKALHERQRAWRKLLQTRHPDALSLAEKTAGDLQYDFALYLEWVGCVEHNGNFKPLFSEQPLHIIFPEAYRMKFEQPNNPDRTGHPTWRLPVGDAPAQRFGGIADGLCSVCGGLLRNLITLKPIPATLNINGLPSVTLATCLSCLGWNWEHYEYLYYEHDSHGRPSSISYGGEPIEPEHLHEPLKEVTVHLAHGGARWRWQIWGCSSQNLHRVGGSPTWIQNTDYPPCAKCQQRMRFILQLDCELLTISGLLWWASALSGMAYGFWCDDCRVSAYVLQIT